MNFFAVCRICGLSVFVCVASVVFSGCIDVIIPMAIDSAPPKTNKSIHSPKNSINLGFFLSQGSSLGDNPKNDRAKICFASFWDHNRLGVKNLSFPVYFEFNPQLDSDGTYTPSEAKAQGSFGKMITKGSFCVEVAGEVPISVFSLAKYPSYVIFTPASGKTYCLIGTLEFGDNAPNWLSLSFSATKTHCEYWFKYKSLEYIHTKIK
ncbi:hypothetical protein [Helicobacter sp. T3_23-1059]